MKTNSEPTFEDFVKAVENKVGGAAKSKGYNTTGPNGKNELYSFIQGLSGNDAHALGEIIYKAVRYTHKRDKDDLLKIAAWAYLIWKFGK